MLFDERIIVKHKNARITDERNPGSPLFHGIFCKAVYFKKSKVGIKNGPFTSSPLHQCYRLVLCPALP